MRLSVVILLYLLTAVHAADYSITGTVKCKERTVNGSCQTWDYDISMTTPEQSCFHGDSLVYTQELGTVPIKLVHPEDHVLTDKGYEPVYTWLHLDHTQQERDWVKICTVYQCITLSPDHMVIHANKTFSFARQVMIGDLLVCGSNESTVPCPPVRHVFHFKSVSGLYAPATDSGTILVNGFLVSIYATTTQHNRAHQMFAPLRSMYKAARFLGLSKYMYHPDSTIHIYARGLGRVRLYCGEDCYDNDTNGNGKDDNQEKKEAEAAKLALRLLMLDHASTKEE